MSVLGRQEGDETMMDEDGYYDSDPDEFSYPQDPDTFAYPGAPDASTGDLGDLSGFDGAVGEVEADYPDDGSDD